MCSCWHVTGAVEFTVTIASVNIRPAGHPADCSYTVYCIVYTQAVNIANIQESAVNIMDVLH
jgi:hypothetical protein